MIALWKWLLNSDVEDIFSHGDWRLRAVAEYNEYVNFALVVLLAGMVWLTIRSYRREGEAPVRAKATLATLRILIIALVFGIIFQPAVVLRFVKTLSSSVVLLIDDSQSMSFKDKYDEPNLAAQRDELARMLNVPAEKLADLSRGEMIVQALAAKDGPLVKLAADHPLVVMRYSTTQPTQSQQGYTREMARIDMVRPEGGVFDPNEASARVRQALGGLTRSGYSTNPPSALRSAMELMEGQRAPVIIHLSDGQITTLGAETRRASAMAYVAERGVRLYSVAVGVSTPPRNVAVTALQAPRETRRGANVEFTAMVAHRNMAGESVTVKLQKRAIGESDWKEAISADGRVVSQAATLEATGDPNQSAQGLQAVSMQLEPDELGDFEYRALIEPLVGEQNTADNSSLAQVTVADEKIRVLLVSGDAGWEFQYLRNFLLQQPDLYRTSIWQQNADKDINQASSNGMKLAQLPQSLEELIGVPGDENKPGYNVIILYDPSPSAGGGFDQHFVKDLLKPFVQEHNGGLCLIAGNKYAETTLLTSEGAKEFADFAEMLPVSLAPNAINEITRLSEGRPEAYPLRLTSYGMDHPVMRMAGTAEESQNVWTNLPGLFWAHPVYKSKPGARTLAVSSNPLRRMSGKNEPLPLVAAQPYGKGNVLYVGFDDTWRWRYVKDGQYHRRFWANVVRYLATLQARRVIITTGGNNFSVGEPITVEVEAYDEKFQPRKEKSYEVQMIDASTNLLDRKIVANAVGDEKPGHFKANFTVDRKGSFKLLPAPGDGDANESTIVKQIEIDLPQAEFVRTEADASAMKAMAYPAENFLTLGQLGRLGEIPVDRGVSIHDEPRFIWDTNLALVMIVVLLAAEWMLRKKHNMA